MSGQRLRQTAGGILVYMGIVRLAHMSVQSMKESPLTASKYESQPHRSVLLPQHVKSLKETGIVVIDNVLTAKELAVIRTEVLRILDHTDEFLDDPNDDLTVRSDSVMWISEKINNMHKSTLSSTLMQTLRMLRSIPFELTSQYGYNPEQMGVPLSNQLACYDGDGAHYVAHRDAPPVIGNFSWMLQPGIYDRELTMVLYLNQTTWDSTTKDGENCDGNLRCFLNTDNDDATGESATSVLNIEPVGGRLVIFDSKRVLHAVLPTTQRRIALTSWVGGSHSSHSWLRNFCIPLEEIDWTYLKDKFLRKSSSSV